ncbi:MAG: NAD(+)/NADH kinase [Treponema sp.]|jgi:NAD+ kinase|nr:NAD(+)/NADH kinase [Treponema sp.]
MVNKKVLLFINNKKSEANLLAEQIQKILENRCYETNIFSFEHEAEKCIPGNLNIGFSLGGDGTVLFASRILGPLMVPVLPVNLGTLGFISVVPPSQWEETFNQWEEGKAIISGRLMLDVTVDRGGRQVFLGCCLNDAVISAAGIAKLVRLEVEAETGSGDRINLGSFRSDGLIVSTPTGSTGYSVAAGGPIIDPEMNAVIINPICPFTLANRPIVVPSDERIITLVEPEQRSAVLLTLDGQVTEPLESGDRIIISRSPNLFKLVASDRWAFYRALRTKLGWSGGNNA